jgi:hypothetical protein
MVASLGSKSDWVFNIEQIAKAKGDKVPHAYVPVQGKHSSTGGSRCLQKILIDGSVAGPLDPAILQSSDLPENPTWSLQRFLLREMMTDWMALSYISCSGTASMSSIEGLHGIGHGSGENSALRAFAWHDRQV